MIWLFFAAALAVQPLPPPVSPVIILAASPPMTCGFTSVFTTPHDEGASAVVIIRYKCDQPYRIVLEGKQTLLVKRTLEISDSGTAGRILAFTVTDWEMKTQMMAVEKLWEKNN